jgi:Matrixin
MMRRVLMIAVMAVLFVGLGSWSVRVGAYATLGHTWASTTVPYYVNPQNLYVPQADAVAALQSAASVWDSQSNANIRLVYAGYTSDASLGMNRINEVFFRDDASGAIAETYWWYDGSGHLVDADIVLHENYVFYAGNVGCTNGYYIENTGAHEFGHVLGLAHSASDAATMWPYSNACETTRETLDSDDIAGIEALYPPSSNVSLPPAAPTQLTVGQDASNPTTSLDVAWLNNASNASGYRVERSSDGYNFSQIAQLGGSASSYVDGGGAPGATYYYRAYAYNNAGASAYSNVGIGQTQAVVVSLPATPSNPSPANGASGVSINPTLSWSSSGAQSYDVYINGSLYGSNLTTRSVPLSSLVYAGTYYWNVVAKNGAGSTPGPGWSFTTTAASVARTRPGKGGGPKK